MINQENILQFIADFNKIDKSRVTVDAPIAELTVDSIVMVEMLLHLQEHFDIVIHQTELEDVVTVGDLIELLCTKNTLSTTP